ncbi:hypothetical protein STANM309S_05645 [Streptomyces tanashiensis]
MEPIQLMPVRSRRAPATSPMVPALATSPPMSSWSEIPGTWSATLSSIRSSWPSVRSAAPTAAATVISGKRARKEMKVIAAASRVQWASSRVSYACQAWVRMRRVTQGPITGSLVSQSMSYVYSSAVGSTRYENPLPERTDPRPTSRTSRPGSQSVDVTLARPAAEGARSLS